MKNYSDEIFMDKLRTIKFPDDSDYTCVNDLMPTRTLLVSFYLQSILFHPLELIKSGFDFNILNAIRKRDKYYK